ncbi:ArsR/SmtB family transcription factor [Proteus hauseri]|uniref:ArsR/SmtB family transcription factor n=1 Tax=Proteus hauseri TaxID=183417 RepID=UPI00100973C6|nr:metalloregulator ArsR/SmtB family transcription factor [Proteus hauseri]QAV24582.1 transcriptional regulator [Proteus hauseri]
MTKLNLEITHESTLESEIATIGAAISDGSRVKILCALMDGRAWTATELSVAAEVSASTTSSHLTKLVNSQLITVISQGKYRYFRLANERVASVIESIMGLSVSNISKAKITTPLNIRKSRTCYNHLAGEIAVSIYDSLCQKKWITENGLEITTLGLEEFKKMGINFEFNNSRKICCPCLDWSERRFHLGGQVGVLFFMHAEKQSWLIRHPGHREITISAKGHKIFAKYFDIV